jgi:hypothetical protein
MALLSRVTVLVSMLRVLVLDAAPDLPADTPSSTVESFVVTRLRGARMAARRAG